MENNLFLLNVASVVQWLSGFVGEIPTSVTAAIKSRFQGSIFQEHQSKNYQSVKAKANVR